jgi:hypothetical protein
MSLKETIGLRWARQSEQFHRWMDQSLSGARALEGKLAELDGMARRAAEAASRHASARADGSGALDELARSAAGAADGAARLSASVKAASDACQAVIASAGRWSEETAGALQAVEGTGAAIGGVRESVTGTAGNAENLTALAEEAASSIQESRRRSSKSRATRKARQVRWSKSRLRSSRCRFRFRVWPATRKV